MTKTVEVRIPEMREDVFLALRAAANEGAVFEQPRKRQTAVYVALKILHVWTRLHATRAKWSCNGVPCDTILEALLRASFVPAGELITIERVVNY